MPMKNHESGVTYIGRHFEITYSRTYTACDLFCPQCGKKSIYGDDDIKSEFGCAYVCYLCFGTFHCPSEDCDIQQERDINLIRAERGVDFDHK